MTFWTNKNLEPKRNFRFVVTLANMPNGATFYAKTVKRPQLQISSQEHKFLNHTFSFPGHPKWQPCDLELVDPVNPDAMQHLAAMIEAAGYVIPANQNQVTTISKRSATDALGLVTIRMINEARGSADEAGGNPAILDQFTIEKWTLNNPWISDCNPSELSYDNEELSTISLQITYDWASLETLNSVETAQTREQLSNVGRPGDGTLGNGRWKA